MTFGLQADESTSLAILDRAFEGGLDFLDTADVYPLGAGVAQTGITEEIIGRWLESRGVRARVLLATKCRGDGRARTTRPVAPHIQRAVDDLRRLGTDVIDLYQTHFPDPHTPIDETLRALDDLVRAGKVRYVGCSNYPLFRLAEAERSAGELGLTRYETLQLRYNLLYREIETEVLPYARQEKLGVIVYNPIAGGLLSGKYRAGEAPREGTRFTIQRAGEMYRQRYWDETSSRGLGPGKGGRGAARARRSGAPGCSRSRASPPRSSARATRAARGDTGRCQLARWS
jgi:aryl-alcohol dehydrogenase (NADP+)